MYTNYVKFKSNCIQFWLIKSQIHVKYTKFMSNLCQIVVKIMSNITRFALLAANPRCSRHLGSNPSHARGWLGLFRIRSSMFSERLFAPIKDPKGKQRPKSMSWSTTSAWCEDCTIKTVKLWLEDDNGAAYASLNKEGLTKNRVWEPASE